MPGLAAIIGLAIGIFLIIKKFPPAYCMILAAFICGLLDGIELTQVVDFMFLGVKDMTPAIVRILAAGVLAGALVKTGAAEKIADSIIRLFGTRNVLVAVVLSAFFLTFMGVFIDVAIITVAPIVLAVGCRTEISRSSLLLALIGGGKSGNIISPNPNTIAAADALKADLSAVMFANWIPAVIGIVATLIIAGLISKRGELVRNTSESESENQGKIENTARLPNLFCALLGPAVVLGLLALGPVTGVKIDPLLALPTGGLVCILVTGHWRRLRESLDYGLGKMSGVAVLLVGTGTLAGVLKNSSMRDGFLSLLQNSGLSETVLAPVSGALMSGATASTTAGAMVAASSFSETILTAGVSAVAGAAMINAGATILDHLPHGSFFHATAGVLQMPFAERLKLIPLESLIGLILAVSSFWVNL